MADNTVLNTGSGGDTIASDDIAGVKHQRVKVQHGADGAATDVSTASPMPVGDAGGSLTVDGTVTANAGTGTMTVDGSGVTQPVSAASLPLPTGASTSAAQLPDGHAVTVDNASGAAAVNIQDGGNSLTVDGTITANAGTGTMTVDGSGVTQPVSAASLPLPTGAATAAAQLADGHNVTVDNAAGASAVNIQDGGNSITIDGAVSGTGTFTVDGSGVTQPVSAASLPLPTGAATSAAQLPDGHNVTVDNASIAVTNAGTFAVQDDNSLNLIDTNNSTTTPLGISATFTGTGTDVSQYAAVTIQLFADEDSAANGMTFQFSTDDTNWDDTYTFTMLASDTRRFQFATTGQYFRVVYTNGGTGQGAFRVQTLLHKRNVLTSIHRVDDDTDPDRSATLVKSVLIAQAAGSGDYLNINSTAGGNLKVAVEEFDTSLPAGTNNIGDVDVASIAAGTAAIGDVGITVRTSGGTTLYKNIDVDESEDQIKGTAGQVYWIHAMNLASGKRYLKFYNATAASVTVGTTVPDLTFPLPTQGDTNGAGFTLSIPNGIAFGTAITIAATTGVADNDSGAPGANEVVVNLGYA